MSNHRLSARHQVDKGEIQVSLEIIHWIEDNIHFFYSPALDLTGYGHTQDEARASFKIILEDFVEYTHKKKTIFDELERLGWTTNKRKKRAVPPSSDEMLQDNDEYRNLISREGISKSNFEVAL